MNQSPTTLPESHSTETNPDALLDEKRTAQLLSINHRTLQQWRLRGVFRFPVERYADKILPSAGAEQTRAAGS